jgi:hypothetical protein
MKHFFIRNLAAAFLNGPWSVDGLAEHGSRACGKRERWIRPVARRVLAAFPARPTGAATDDLIRFLNSDEGLAHGARLTEQPHEIFWVAPAMIPAAGRPALWDVPALATEGALAGWLGLTPAELDWFADCRGREADVSAGPLRHYTYQWQPKRTGKKWRLLEMPKPRLKALQRRLLGGLLDHVPPHDAAHGYRRNRSIASYVAPHVEQAIVLRFDLHDFFPSIRSGRIRALFRTAGYPTTVARLLTGLCTNVVPADVLDTAPYACEGLVQGANIERLRWPHLPQGAPTSAALANLCAYRLDCRLAALARSVNAHYTRYADDLAFSGDELLARSARRFQVMVCRIALEEGFEVHVRKTRFMRRSVRQQLCGIVVNARPNIPRAEYDRLKAILHNCIHQGPSGQNRDGHDEFRAYLAGRIGYVAMLHAARGQKLRVLFDQIAWAADVQQANGDAR